MKVGVISDTHGNLDGARAAVKRLVEHGARFILHLGDGIDDAINLEKIAGVPVQYVAGNCDHHPGASNEHYFSWRGMGVLAIHGHAEDINKFHIQESRNKSLDKLAARAGAVDAGIVLFGHTHYADDFVHSGIRFINPGALDLGTAEKSCCLIDIGEENVTVKHFRIS